MVKSQRLGVAKTTKGMEIVQRWRYDLDESRAEIGNSIGLTKPPTPTDTSEGAADCQDHD